MQSKDALTRNTASLFTMAFGFHPNARRFKRSSPNANRCAPQTLQRQCHRRRPQKPEELYDPEIARMKGHASAYAQSDATGFIRLNALRLKLRAALKGRGD